MHPPGSPNGKGEGSAAGGTEAKEEAKKGGAVELVRVSKEMIKNAIGNPEIKQLIALNIVEYKFHFKKEDDYYSGEVKFSNGENIEAKFFKCDSEMTAKNIWEYSKELNHNVVLKVMFITKCDAINSWIVCYERFEKMLDSWLSSQDDYQPKTADNWLDSKSALLIRKLIEGVLYLHKKGIAHKGLAQSANYVVVANTIKIINIGAQSTRFQEPTNQLIAPDFLGLEKLLGDKILPIGDGKWLERNSFLACFDLVQSTVIKKFNSHILKHPFLKTEADDRMYTFQKIMHEAEVDPGSPRKGYFISALHSQDPCTGFQMYQNWVDWKRSSILEKVYNFENLDSKRPTHYRTKDYGFSLLTFLRNAYWHMNNIQKEEGQKKGDNMIQLDRDVRSTNRDFLNRVYMAACCVFDRPVPGYEHDVQEMVVPDVPAQESHDQSACVGSSQGQSSGAVAEETERVDNDDGFTYVGPSRRTRSQQKRDANSKAKRGAYSRPPRRH